VSLTQDTCWLVVGLHKVTQFLKLISGKLENCNRSMNYEGCYYLGSASPSEYAINNLREDNHTNLGVRDKLGLLCMFHIYQVMNLKSWEGIHHPLEVDTRMG